MFHISIYIGAVNLGVQPLLENAFADCFLTGCCAVPAREQLAFEICD